MLVSNLLQKPIQTAADEWTKANDQYVNQAKNTLAGTRTLNLYGQQNNAVKRDLKVINLLETKLARMNILKNNTNAYLNLIAMGGSYLVPFAIGIMLVIKGFTTLGALFGIIQLSNSFVNPILQILSERNNLSTTKGIVKRITQFGQKAATYPQTTSMTANLVELEVKDLSLIRQGQQLASDIDLTIGNGQKIAVIGPSGAGKSTLLQYLLYGDYGQASKILLNHQQVDAGAFTNLFAYSSQNAVIFADTLLFNLTLGADIAPDKIMAVCQGVGLAKLIQEKGLNYDLGDNADQLSGGQLSRIELARAILAQRQILLLDEVNASLDQVTSKQVHDYLFASDLTFIEVIHHYKPADLARYDQVIDFNSYLSS